MAPRAAALVVPLLYASGNAPSSSLKTESQQSSEEEEEEGLPTHSPFTFNSFLGIEKGGKE